ncbi:beta-alanine-activating enzyme isoform X1 [Salvelinus fontinalis]|uniref:beta-alanine-activating enzyme isoform X1 n=2 Tax=Salvelinus fontinalis TaxID=8038 RepID=UPI0024851B05|nr:beta-alanine-activating enzyme isoform X1 [Salvelinus fontinalis]
MATKTLQDMVLAAASLHSGKIAVTFDKGITEGGPMLLYYHELVALGNELTLFLQIQCVQNTRAIALYCQPDINLPVWILGILQLPAAYVPLDPDAPALLSARVMEQCGLKYCVLQSDLLQQFQMAFSNLMSIEVCAVWSAHNLTLVLIQHRPTAARKEEPNADLFTPAAVPESASQGALAYILHTSGTTGLPKTVRVPHKCIVPNILHLRSLFQMTPDDVVFLASPLTFDPSVVEIFLALSSGARLLIVPTVIKRMPNRLADVLFKKHKTTVLQVTPTLLGRFGRRVLQEEVLSAGSCLRVLALGGEACPSLALLRSWRQQGNCTHIYNIYGITEVSCWACCYHLPESLLQSTDVTESSVPLGPPLMETTVELRDEDGCVITQGEGQVFIGGMDRVCLLDDEVTVAPGTMRSTGDWVQIRDTHLYFLGRRDRLVKRHGQRLHLDTLQQVVMSLPQVEACAVGLYEGSRLVTFVVACSISGEQKATHTSSPVEQQVEHREETAPSTRGLQKAILHRLSQLLPSHSVPDTLVLVPALPLSSHGKVSMGELMKIYQRQRAGSESHSALGDMETLRERLQSLWRETLGLTEDEAIQEDSNFLFSGGDSLQALRLCDDITTAVGVTSSGLLEVILDGSFSEILRRVAIATLTFPSEHSLTSHPVAMKRPADPVSSALPKRQHTDPYSTTAAEWPLGVVVSYLKKAVRCTVVRRAGEVVEMGQSDSLRTNENSYSDSEGPIKRTRNTQEKGANESTESNHSQTFGSNKWTERNHSQAVETNDPSASSVTPPLREAGGLGLRVSWESDTGRCVDASPVLLVQKGADGSSGGTRATVFIGSHSHRMQALDLTTGGLLWERVLGDRIESSSAVSRCGRLVVVGCYDGGVYFLCVESGETQWVFETGDAVKSSPTVDPLTGLVMVGSHDGHVYALDPQVQQCVWKHHCGCGAVFSSPCLHPSLRQLYVATLGGHLLCLNPDTGAVLWTYSRKTPFFSSPSCSSGHIIIGSVDGNICCFSHTGEMVWQYVTNGPVFSSPCITPDKQRVVCGSHDGCVYCLNCTDGSLVWRYQTPSRVYSSPCVFEGSSWGKEGTLVGLASTDGTLCVLDGEDGTLRASLSLLGELFSSPVVWERSLVVGCRNDFVYCVAPTGELD